MKKELFIKFLKEIRPSDFQSLLPRFEQHYSWLLKENEKLNLISRKTDPEDIWTVHFLDSLLSVNFVDFSSKRVLDFGTGGGFPGIPLAILYPASRFTLLDSTKKKIASVKSAAEQLGLANCSFSDVRIEELASSLNGTFDVVVSRSVRMLPLYKKVIMRLLNAGGKLVLYKSRNLDDVELFPNARIHDVSTPEIGERKIIVIDKP